MQVFYYNRYRDAKKDFKQGSDKSSSEKDHKANKQRYYIADYLRLHAERRIRKVRRCTVINWTSKEKLQAVLQE